MKNCFAFLRDLCVLRGETIASDANAFRNGPIPIGRRGRRLIFHQEFQRLLPIAHLLGDHIGQHRRHDGGESTGQDFTEASKSLCGHGSSPP